MKFDRNQTFSSFFLAFFSLLKTSVSIDLLDVNEGSCQAIRDVSTVDNINPSFLDRLTFIPGGSKYQLYSYAKGHPNFSRMRDFEFFYQACLYKNISIEEGGGSTFGFGDQQLVTYDVRKRNSKDEVGVSVVMSERSEIVGTSGNIFTSKITLTDNENFAVLVHCWEDGNQKSWSIYSKQYALDTETRRRVEQHVVELGFAKDHIAFLEYENCRYDKENDGNNNVTAAANMEVENDGNNNVTAAATMEVENDARTSSAQNNTEPSGKTVSVQVDKSESPNHESFTVHESHSSPVHVSLVTGNYLFPAHEGHIPSLHGSHPSPFHTSHPHQSHVPASHPHQSHVPTSHPHHSNDHASHPHQSHVPASHPHQPSVHTSHPHQSHVPASHPHQSHVPATHPHQSHVPASHPHQSHVPATHPHQSHVPASHPHQSHVPASHPHQSNDHASHPHQSHVQTSHPSPVLSPLHVSHPSVTHASHPSVTHASHPSVTHASHPSVTHASHPSVTHAIHPSGTHPSHPSATHANHPSGTHSSHPSGTHSSHPSTTHASHPSVIHASHPSPVLSPVHVSHPSSAFHLGHQSPLHGSRASVIRETMSSMVHGSHSSMVHGSHTSSMHGDKSITTVS